MTFAMGNRSSLWFNIVFTLTVFGLGFGLGATSRRSQVPAAEPGSTCTIERTTTTQLINPLLDCELADGKINRELVPFKPAVQDLVDSYLAKHVLSHTSVYFRDLNNGAWFGIGEKDDYSPASLLKVPLLFAYYKWNEESPGVLDRKLRFTAPDAAAGGYTQFVKPEQEITPGETYTVHELIERMIRYSDNQANALLEDNIPHARIEQTFKLLGLSPEVYSDLAVDISVKQYAAFFRILFNASYLNRESSIAALELLSHTDFTVGLVAGVSKGTLVAHKFGERGAGAQGKQFHDCGIVYYPDRPYILCVMTRGRDYRQQVSAIAGISKLVFDEVNSQFTKR